MNQQETKLKQNIQADIRMFKATLAETLSALIDLEADVEWHFDQYEAANQISPEQQQQEADRPNVQEDNQEETK